MTDPAEKPPKKPPPTGPSGFGMSSHKERASRRYAHLARLRWPPAFLILLAALAGAGGVNALFFLTGTDKRDPVYASDLLIRTEPVRRTCLDLRIRVSGRLIKPPGNPPGTVHYEIRAENVGAVRSPVEPREVLQGTLKYSGTVTRIALAGMIELPPLPAKRVRVRVRIEVAPPVLADTVVVVPRRCRAG